MGGRGVQSGHRETSEEAIASNSNKRFWGHGWQRQWWPEVEGPGSAHICFHQGPNTLIELLKLQEHWALSQSWASTKAAHSAKNALSNFDSLANSPVYLKGWAQVSPSQHAFHIALSYPGMTELLHLYHSTHKRLPSAHLNKKGANLLCKQAHLTPKIFVFSEICATMQFSAKSELSNMVAMSHM